jgi:acetyl esterase/lipase
VPAVAKPEVRLPKSIDPALSKSDRPFPLPKPIHGYKYGQVVKLTKRDDGLFIKADSEYRKAREQIEEFRVTTFNKRLTDKTVKTQVPTPSVKGMFVKEDVTYATWDKRALLLDLYGPEKKLSEKRPVIIVVHGGGWGRGSHKSYRPFAVNLAKRGFSTIAVEYRLSGEAPVPAAIYDIKACVRWIRANASKYKFNPNAIGITGGSAGGHLSALTAVTNHDNRFEGTANHLEFSSEINAVLSFYGPFAWLFKQALGTEMDGRISFKEALPDYHIKNGAKFPPIQCINENDRKFHKNWGESTVQWIKDNRAGEADFFILDAPHGYLNFSPFQEKAIDHAEEFFRKVFKQ